MGSKPDLSVCQSPDKLTGKRGQQEVEGVRYEDVGLPQLSYMSANGLCDLTALCINSKTLSHYAGFITHSMLFASHFRQKVTRKEVQIQIKRTKSLSLL